MNSQGKHIVIVLAATLMAITASVPAAPREWQARIEANQVVVTIDGAIFACYKFDGAQKYPYFWPVNGPASDQSVTTETSQPYPHHHSLFFGCDRVNGGNYWQDVHERGQIVSEGPKLVKSSGRRVVITDRCHWRQPGKEPIMRDTYKQTRQTKKIR